MFVDGDCALVADWLPLAIARLDSDDRVAVVYGRRRNEFEGIPESSVSADHREASVLGGNALYRRSALLAVGGFNPFLKSEEEGELLARLCAAGFRAASTPELMCTHHTIPKDTLSSQWRRLAHGMTAGPGQTLRLALRDGLLRYHAPRFNRYLAVLAYVVAGLLAAIAAAAGAGSGPVVLWLGLGAIAFALLWLRQRRLRSAVYIVWDWLMGSTGLLVGFVVPPRRIEEFVPIVEQLRCPRPASAECSNDPR
jgi:hypothetical protein